MGFQVEINSILRSDEYDNIQVGDALPFTKSGSRVFFDDIPVWLTRSDWTALAEIQVLTQTREPGRLRGEFEVLHVYSSESQQQMTNVFRRMYADKGHPFVYLLMSTETLRRATETGEYAPDSLQTEGFVHASPADQLTRIANKYYREHSLVHVAFARKTLLRSPVKWEPATGGLYPHLYGPLNMDAVVNTVPFVQKDDGEFEILLNP